MAAKYKLMKTLSAIEVEEKMEMSLCFLCDEPLTLDHNQLKHENVKIVMRISIKTTNLKNPRMNVHGTRK